VKKRQDIHKTFRETWIHTSSYIRKRENTLHINECVNVKIRHTEWYSTHEWFILIFTWCHVWQNLYKYGTHESCILAFTHAFMYNVFSRLRMCTAHMNDVFSHSQNVFCDVFWKDIIHVWTRHTMMYSHIHRMYSVMYFEKTSFMCEHGTHEWCILTFTECILWCILKRHYSCVNTAHMNDVFCECKNTLIMCAVFTHEWCLFKIHHRIHSVNVRIHYSCVPKIHHRIHSVNVRRHYSCVPYSHMNNVFSKYTSQNTFCKCENTLFMCAENYTCVPYSHINNVTCEWVTSYWS